MGIVSPGDKPTEERANTAWSGAPPSDAPMMCLECGEVYDPGIQMCPDCDLPLVAQDVDGLEAPRPGHAHVEYDLEAWGGDARLMLDRLLSGVPVPHTWQGGRLVVPEDHEAVTDDLVGQVESTVDEPWPFEADEQVVGFLIDDLDDAALDELVVSLDAGGIPHAFDGGELVARSADADVVDELLDAVDNPDALDPDAEDPAAPASDADDDGGTDDDLDDADLVDIDPDAVLGGLFVAVDRLRSSARDSKGVLGAVDAAEILESARRPFGFETATWKGLVSGAVGMRDLLESETATDDDIEEAAEALRSRLRPVV